MELITVVIPAYNAEKTIEGCLESICNQTYRNLEIIVINDGSTDRTAELCDEWAKRDTRIYVIHSKNEGVSAARNKGIDNATGVYLKFVDSDDSIDSNCIETEWRCIVQNDADLVVSGYRKITVCGDEEIKPQEGVYLRNEFGTIFPEIYPRMFLNVPWNKLFKREKIIQRFDEKYYLGEDVLFNFQYMCEIERIALCSAAQYRFNSIQAGSLRKRYREHDIEYAAEIYQKLLEITKELWVNRNCKTALDYVYIENVKSILRRLISSDCPGSMKRRIVKESVRSEICREVSSEAMKKGINKLILWCYKYKCAGILWLLITVTEAVKR